MTFTDAPTASELAQDAYDLCTSWGGHYFPRSRVTNEALPCDRCGIDPDVADEIAEEQVYDLARLVAWVESLGYSAEVRDGHVWAAFPWETVEPVTGEVLVGVQWERLGDGLSEAIR